VLALTLLLGACGDDGNDTSSTGTTEAPAQTTTTKAATTTTAKPTTTTAAAAGSFAAGSPEAAVATAYSTVFDSSTALDAKKPHLENADALADTITAYSAAGQRFGGIKLTPTAVAINGDTATVTYDVYFGTNKQYGDLSGAIARTGGNWIVSRGEFCGFMQSARTPCPA
jgi:iron complex transport system substrate-binding protein